MSWPVHHGAEVRKRLRRKFGSLVAQQIESMAREGTLNVVLERGEAKITAPANVASWVQDWMMENIYDEKRRRGEA